MTAKLFQNLCNQIKEMIGIEFGIMNEAGLIIACSNEERVGMSHPEASVLTSHEDNCLVSGDTSFLKVFIKGRLEYIAFIESGREESRNYLSLISISICNIKSNYEEKFDRLNFIKEAMAGSILPGDILLRAKELHIAGSVSRVVYIIKTEKVKDVYVHEIIEGLFPNKSRDYIVTLDEQTTVLIKEFKPNAEIRDIEKTASIIIDTINTELMIKTHIGIGTLFENLADINRSFKEAQLALIVGSIFENDKKVINYNSLGLGRLIYQIPVNLCVLFLREVFKEGSIEALDNETLLTIQKFFENNLNVSETSRQLYVHRNTLVYRLDKILKTTGLDLRNFDDAIIFKVAMLVKRFLDSNKAQDMI